MCEYVCNRIMYGWQTDYKTLAAFCDKMGATDKDSIGRRIDPFLPEGLEYERVHTQCKCEEEDICELYLVLKIENRCTLAELCDIDPKTVERAHKFMVKEFAETREPQFYATAHHN